TNAASSGSTRHRAASAWRTRWRVWATNSSTDDSRIGSGSTTTVAPASQVAWMAVTSSRVVGDSRATWSPGRTPRAWRAAAYPLACSCSSRQGTTTSSPPTTNVTAVSRSAARWRRRRSDGITGPTSGRPRGLHTGRGRRPTGPPPAPERTSRGPRGDRYPWRHGPDHVVHQRIEARHAPLPLHGEARRADRDDVAGPLGAGGHVPHAQ